MYRCRIPTTDSYEQHTRTYINCCISLSNAIHSSHCMHNRNRCIAQHIHTYTALYSWLCLCLTGIATSCHFIHTHYPAAPIHNQIGNLHCCRLCSDVMWASHQRYTHHSNIIVVSLSYWGSVVLERPSETVVNKKRALSNLPRAQRKKTKIFHETNKLSERSIAIEFHWRQTNSLQQNFLRYHTILSFA